MDFEWDPAKRAANLLKHGLDFADAPEIFETDHLVKLDSRKHYGEIRLQCLGMIRDRLAMVVFTRRNGVLRIISMRKANEREAKIFQNRLGKN